MPSIDNLDFLNLNSLRNYPLKEGVSRLDSLGAWEIPNDFIVDMQLAATYDVTRRFYVSKISNFEDYINIEISDHLDVLVGSFNVTTSSHNPNTEYTLTATPEYVGATGRTVIGDLGSMQISPSGSFLFTIANTELEARAIIPALKGINRLIFRNADDSEVAVTGDVEIIARTNVRFKSGGVNTVIIDAGEDIGLNTDCAEDGCIRTINGIPPDEEHNFTLDFAECAALTTIPAGTGLLLSDICCKPCMGCDDIEEITGRLTSVESSLIALRDYYDALNKLFTDFQTTVGYTCDC